MPERLESFTFDRHRGHGPRWAQYLDGSVYRFTEEDGKFGTIRSALNQAALRRGMKVRTQMVDGALVAQAFTPDAE